MNVRNCRKCRKLFNYITGNPICPSCKTELEEKFQTVKTYIRNNPRATIEEVSENCDIDRPQIQQWIREERLEFTEDSLISVTCESCGALIKSGRLCESCKNNLTKGFQSILNQTRQTEPQVTTSSPSKNKMRFF